MAQPDPTPDVVPMAQAMTILEGDLKALFLAMAHDLLYPHPIGFVGCSMLS